MTLKATAIFTPNGYPEYTYVPRTKDGLEQKLRDGVDTQNQIISISGPSKSGKTVLAENVIGRDNLIVVTGAGISHPDQVWDKVLDWMEAPHAIELAESTTDSTVRGNKGTGTIGIPNVLSVGGEHSQLDTNAKQHQRTVIRHRNGLESVIREISDSDYVILLDDFHYMSRDVQEEVAKQLKEAARRGVKVCVAAVPHRSDDMVRANPELRGRVLSIDVGYWSKDELKQIAIVGFEKLDAELDKETLGWFAAESAGSPQLMQAICLHACFQVELRERASARRVLALDGDREKIFANTSATTDFRSLVDVLDGGPKPRGTERKTYHFRDGKQGDVYRCVLRAIADDPPRLSWNYAEINRRVRNLCSDNDPPVGSSIVTSCQQMQILASAKFPDERVIEWDEQKQVLDIVDPYLLFYLRWSGRLQEDDK